MIHPHVKINCLPFLKGHCHNNLVVTCQPLERVEQDTDRDHWMSAEESVGYGIVGKIISDISELD